MNCYYSNLIEGHNTRPCDIKRALAGAELEAETCPLALEARAHVIGQRSIDKMHRDGILPRPTSVGFLAWMPDGFRRIEHPGGTWEPIIPGRMRQEGDSEVAGGRHLPRPRSGRIISTTIPDYGPLGERTDHCHRLGAPSFPDGNGQLSRLMSHAMALEAGIGGQGLWSVSCGLAERGESKRMMDMADTLRRGDRDGRGNLSEAALKTYCEWLLKVARDHTEGIPGIINAKYG